VGAKRWQPIQALCDRTQLVRGYIGVRATRYCHADQRTAAKRHRDQFARLDFRASKVIEDIVSRRIECHPHDGKRCPIGGLRGQPGLLGDRR